LDPETNVQSNRLLHPRENISTKYAHNFLTKFGDINNK